MVQAERHPSNAWSPTPSPNADAAVEATSTFEQQRLPEFFGIASLLPAFNVGDLDDNRVMVLVGDVDGKCSAANGATAQIFPISGSLCAQARPPTFRCLV
jgi:hypothetical protein